MVELLGRHGAETALVFCIAPIVFLAVWTDLKSFRIPNELSIAGLAVFALTCMIFLPLAEIPSRLIGAGIVFAICFVLFAVGAVGGGDAKLGTVLALFIPGYDAMLFLTALSVCGLVGVGVIRVVAPRVSAAHFGAVSEWQVWTKRKHFPFGYAMGGALTLYIVHRLMI